MFGGGILQDDATNFKKMASFLPPIDGHRGIGAVNGSTLDGSQQTP